MQPQLSISIPLVASLLAIGSGLLLRYGTRWGSTSTDRATQMPGDVYLKDGPRARVAMTRAISIRAKPETVWPWLTQLGRGAGWYSVDRLDNGGKISAQHLVSWIPQPRLGDASAIGYLRHIERDRALTWWVGGVRFAGSTARLVTDIQLSATGEISRLVIRMSADAKGAMAPIALLVFRFVDSIMTRRQLIEIKRRVEQYGARYTNPDEPETGSKEQYQLYEVIFASGEKAGAPGKELAARWRQTAIEDGTF